MKFQDLPAERTSVGTATTREGLTSLFTHALGDSAIFFRYLGRAKGGPYSCRVLSTEFVAGYTDTRELPSSQKRVAQDFILLDVRQESRRDPKERPEPVAWKGWSVEEAIMDGKILLIVSARWVIESASSQLYP